ncbi:MAG: SCP2 domain-containing protein [Methylophilaceae bacterium]|nr:SCP2 sterol-binding domain-containing protein [Methyloradius sp.]
MLKPILTRLLNHLITQNSWARAELIPFAGKSVRFNMPPISASLTILEDGGLAMAGDASQPDATVTISLPIALRLLAKDEAAAKQARLEGDTELAMALSKVMQNLEWEYEEDLSRVIGDIPANKIATFGRETVAGIKKQSLNAAEMLAEYWQEEQPMIAKKRHVEKFISDVDTLRDDAERLGKRFDKLMEKLEKQAVGNTPPNSTETPSS